jgi:hypothetical protein
LSRSSPSMRSGCCCCRQPQNLLILSMKILKDPARITKSSRRDPHGRRQLTRVNSTNVLDEGLRIGGTGRRMNSEVNRSNKVVSKVNVRWTLAWFQSFPHRPLLAPIYRWPGLKDRKGSDTDYNIDIR